MAKPKAKKPASRRRASAQPGARDERLVVRRLRVGDIPAVRELQRRCFPGIAPFSEANIRSHLRLFPAGQIVVELDGAVVATSSTLMVEGSTFQDPHTYKQVSGEGSLSTHDPEGDVLYGIDIAVDPAFRGLRLSRRIYEARKELCAKLQLRGIIIGGRAPNFHKFPKLGFAEYLRDVVSKTKRDPTITAQLANGFTIRCALPGYLPSDIESGGNAVLMEWRNPSYVPSGERALAQVIRVASVQYEMRTIHSFEEFCSQCEFYMDTAADYRCDFLLFPELLTTQLQSLVAGDRPGAAARRLHEFTPRYLEFFSQSAIRYHVNIIGGTHLVVENGVLYNAAFLFRRDGSVDRQLKIHITPSERRWWGVEPGSEMRVFDTDRGPIAILICYDIEFPELSRIAAEKGARVFFVPYNTDIRQSHMRVRSCALSRCIENHVYCVTAGAVGNLPFVEGADIHYAESAILTPCDIPFPRDGVATEAIANADAMLVHDLEMNTLRRNRRTGMVRPWHDRRTDYYRVHYKEGDRERKV